MHEKVSADGKDSELPDIVSTEELEEFATPKKINKKDEPTESFIRFYGLYWRKKHIDQAKTLLLGKPAGKVGKGRKKTNQEEDSLQLNFWGQKGIYILYDLNMHPIYAGQAGVIKRNSGESPDTGCIGRRLTDHVNGPFKNAWSYFSWFGILDLIRPKQTNGASVNDRISPDFAFRRPLSDDVLLNKIIASLEAVLIEGSAPRFNSRGGDLVGSSFVKQYEGTRERFVKSSGYGLDEFLK